jgi:hypothetical protein
MAYVHKDVITKARTALKALNKEYGVKATLSGENSSSLKLTIAQGEIDFIGNYCENVLAKRIQHDTDGVVTWVQREMYIQVNHYYLDSSFSGKALEYLEKAKEIMHVDHWDKSDIQSDYFNCAYYVNINIGRWNKGYILKPN